MWYAVIQYIKYIFRAQSGLYLHSPFMFDFYYKVLHIDGRIFETIKKIKKIYAQNKNIITKNDLGAGSKLDASKKCTIRSIAQNTSVKSKYGKVLNQICHFYDIENVIELGTSLGISTAYFALNNNCNIYTIEGDENISDIAKIHLKEFKNIEFMVGDFDEKLLPTLQKIKKADLIYFDGNHQYEPTLRYFLTSLEYIHNSTIFIFDDIYWSEGMTKAWKDIKNHKKVTRTIDLYKFGVVFFDNRFKEKEHFTIFY